MRNESSFNIANFFAECCLLQNIVYLCIAFENEGSHDDSLAQQVEHNTFNVGVLGSSPRRITKKGG